MGKRTTVLRPRQDFDLAAETKAIHTLKDRVAERVRASLRDQIEVGRRLRRVRDNLDHGQFLNWLKREFGWSIRHAEYLMSLRRLPAKIATLANLPKLSMSAAYMLAGKKVSEEVIDEAVRRLLAGETVTPKTLKVSAVVKNTVVKIPVVSYSVIEPVYPPSAPREVRIIEPVSPPALPSPSEPEVEEPTDAEQEASALRERIRYLERQLSEAIEERDLVKNDAVAALALLVRRLNEGGFGDAELAEIAAAFDLFALAKELENLDRRSKAVEQRGAEAKTA